MIMKNKVLFRCDGGLQNGFGHLVRCLALAEELKTRHRIESGFALRQDETGSRYLRESGYPVFESTPGEKFDYEGWILETIAESAASILALDVRDDFPESVLDKCRNEGIGIVSIDDPSERKFKADLTFLPPVPQLNRVDLSMALGQFYIGWDWILLRSYFAKEYSSPVNDIPSILVTMGGSDSGRLTCLAIESLSLTESDFNATVISGRGFDASTLRSLIGKSSKKIELRSGLENNMAEMMCGSDLAIASFGMTAYELAAMGVPSILLSLTPDHLDSASALVELGVSESLGLFGDINPAGLAVAVDRLLQSPEQLRQMSEVGKKSIDGRGVARIADLIANWI